MRINRRLLVPVAAAAALVLAGCSGGTASAPSASAPTPGQSGAPDRADADLVIWTDALKIDAVQEVADAFAEDQGISVQVQAVSTDLQTNFVTANSAGNGPDVVVGAHDWIGNLVQNGAIDPLQLTPEELSGYGEKAVQAVTYDQQLYGVPYGVEAVALYRNTGIVPDEPANLDEAVEMGEAAVEAGDTDSALNLPVGENGDAYHMESILTSMGGYLFSYSPETGYDASDLGIGQEGSLAAAQKIADLASQDVLRSSISGDNAIALFAEGQAAFLVSGPWALPQIREAGIDYAVQPMPGFAGEEPAVPFMGAQAFMVASGAQNAAFAQEFVTRGVNNEEAMQTMYDLAALPPALTSVAEGVDDEDIAVFNEAAEGGAPMPAIPEMASVWEPLGKAYAAIVGGADPDATMESAGETISAAING